MIRFEDVTFAYDGAPSPALRGVSLAVTEGELCLVVGPTGSGKSTLLRAVNGLVPWFSGGRLDGRVTVAGRSTADTAPRDMADVVGFVGQVPSTGFVTDVVEDELAYTMENLGVAPPVMRKRVEEVIDLLGLQAVRHRSLRTLSSGEQQRVAIASVLTAMPRVLVLDEPTSALDPGASEDVLAAVTRLVHDLGLTVLMAEHRLERVVQYADRVVVVDAGTVTAGPPADVLRQAPVAPPVVELGRLAGWSPLPLSVRDARRSASHLRHRLADREPSSPAHPAGATPTLQAQGLVARYGTTTALAGVDLALHAGEVTAVMGRNGAGKTTLLAHLAGLRRPTGGRVMVGDAEPADLPPPALIRRVALVPADAGILLHAATVGAELAASDRDSGLAPGTTATVLRSLVEGVAGDDHPRDLSEGQRLALALAVVLAPEPGAVLLDEPTRGLDYRSKASLVAVLRRLAAEGRAVALATHDVELVADVADRVVVMADGEVVADGPAREIVAASPMFAPQVAKILSPAPWLTVAEVKAALAS